MSEYRKHLIPALGLFVTLFVTWLLWSGLYKPLLLGLGVFSCALCVYLAHRIGFFERKSGLHIIICLLYTSPSPRDLSTSRMPSSA